MKDTLTLWKTRFVKISVHTTECTQFAHRALEVGSGQQEQKNEEEKKVQFGQSNFTFICKYVVVGAMIARRENCSRLIAKRISKCFNCAQKPANLFAERISYTLAARSWRGPVMACVYTHTHTFTTYGLVLEFEDSPPNHRAIITRPPVEGSFHRGGSGRMISGAD